MTVRHYVRNPAGDIVEVIVRPEAFEVHDNAEEGSVGSGQVTVDDDAGALDIVGHRKWYVTEDEIPDLNGQVIFHGYTADRDIQRGPSQRTGAARQWKVNLVDSNSVLARRIMTGNDAKRPAETDVERMQWVTGTAELGIIDDYRWVFTTQPVKMDAVDYNGQRVLDIIDDCAQSSGKNYWVDYVGDTQELSIWYGRNGLPDYEAAIAISNDLEDINGDSIFEMSADAKLTRDPGRVYSGVYLPFDGGYVYREKTSTSAAFARRDQSMPSANVKSAAKASRRATRYLNDLDTEEDRITLTILVPPTHVNKVRKGQWINVRATHWPGYETFTPVRVLSKATSRPAADFYKIDLELSGGDALPGTGNGSARLSGSFNRDELTDIYPLVYFHGTGDDPPSGYNAAPLTGPLSYVEFAGYEGSIWSGIQVDGDGVVDVRFSASIVAVVSGSVTATISVLLDGVMVASAAIVDSGGLRGFAPGLTCTQTDIAVTAGQVFTCLFSISGTSFGHGKVPAGVGAPNEYFEVTGTFEEIA